MSDHLTPPRSSGRDTAHGLARAAISAGPMLGGPAAELFDLIVPSSLERRRRQWFQLVADRIQALEGKGVDLEALSTDEGFITVLIEASKAALGTHIMWRPVDPSVRLQRGSERARWTIERLLAGRREAFVAHPSLFVPNERTRAATNASLLG